MSQAYAVECNNEDGQLTVEVQYHVDDHLIHALTTLGKQMDEAVLRVHARPVCRCGSDARYEATQDTGVTVHLCSTCVETTYDWRFAEAL